MNPYTDEDDVDAFADYENRQRQIEEDRILANWIQQQEFHQQQHLRSNSPKNQNNSTETDEELAVCLLANYLHQQEGLTSQSEPEQTFSGVACASSDVTNRTELDHVIAHSLLESTPSQASLQFNSTSLTNTETDTAGDQQALEEALSLSLLESQHHARNETSHDQQALDEALALSLSTLQVSGQTRGNDLNENLDYENLLDLEDLIGSVAAMGLSSNQLQMLPTYKYKERPRNKASALDKRGESCAICLTVFESGSDVKLLPCLHTFHERCIDEWLQRKAVCPTCNIQVKL